MTAAANYSFFFRAMTPAGGRTMGIRAAPSESRLAEDLRRDQLVLLTAWKLPVGAQATPRLPLKDEAALNEQLYALLARGVPLVEALEVAASVVSDKSRPTISRLREQVAAGTAFADACAKAGGFDDVTIAVYRSAERTGDLAGAAQRLAAAARRRLAIAGKAVTVMIYPCVVSGIALLLFLGMLMFLVPQIAKQVDQLNATIPAFSRFVFGIGEWMGANRLLVVSIILGLVVAGVIARRQTAAGLRRFASLLPAFRDLLLTVEMTRFFSVMAAMTRSGVPLADALGTATGVISGANLRTQLEQLRKNLVEGGVLRVLIDKVEALPLATRRLLIAAERAGDLDSAFDALSADMAAEVDKKSGRLLAVLEPAVIVGMFLLLGPLIIAIAVPMMTFRSGAG